MNDAIGWNGGAFQKPAGQMFVLPLIEKRYIVSIHVDHKSIAKIFYA
jgi:hypothetical protein